jgi:Protein of unknown function (DUF4019)
MLRSFRWASLAVMTAGLLQTPLIAMQGPPQADPHATEESAAERQALGFLGYLDDGRFADSYAYTGMLLRAKADSGAYAAQIQKARAGTGALQARELIDAAYNTSVEGAPQGQYVILHYHSNFANRPDTVETITLALAKGYWRVDGYYIK